jgi:hypothetical protein
MTMCIKCRTRPAAAKPTTGRTPVYCGVACRRAAELEIRRVNRRLTALEQALVAEKDRSYAPLGDLADGQGRFAAQRIAALRDRIAEEEERLRALLT